jgi:hypothetical protein
MSLWLSIILSIVVLILAIVLFSSIFFHLILDDKRKRGSLQWLGASFFWDWSTKKTGFDLFNLRIWRGSLEKKEKPKKEKEEKKKKKPNYIILWQEKEVMARTAKIAFSSLGDLLRKSKLEKFILDARFGTPDPALTGVLYGGISSISFPLQTFLPDSCINVYPDFEAPSLSAKTRISSQTRLLHLFWIIVRAFFSLPKMAIIRLIRKLKKSRR